jgi:hypothetical protein
MLPSLLLLRSLLLMVIPKFLEVPAGVGVPAVAAWRPSVIGIPSDIASILLLPPCYWHPFCYCFHSVIASLLLLASLLLRVRTVAHDPVIGVALL